MPPFESLVPLLESKRRAPGRFRELCANVFGTVEGAELMAMLCTMEHPMDHAHDPDPRAASHHAGRREVISTLWRYSASSNAVHTLPEEGPRVSSRAKRDRRTNIS